MMKPRLYVILVMLAVSLGFSALVHAETTVTRVTSNSYEDYYPRMEGDYLVWQAYLGNDWEIFVYNITTEVITQVTDNEHDDISPRTDGIHVVWQVLKDGDWDIFLWNGTEILPISDSGAEDVFPQIADGRIVWTSMPLGDDFVGPGEVILYEVATGIRLTLSSQVDPGNTLDDSSPRMDDEVIIWVQTDEEGNRTPYIYNLSNGMITENPDRQGRNTPQTDGNLRVLTKRVGQDREIFLHNSQSMRYHQITDNSIEDRSPVISGNHVAWMAGGEVFLAECKYLSPIRPEDSAMLSRSAPPSFTWEGIGYDRFRVQFSEDLHFPISKTLILPLGSEKWLSETSLTPTDHSWKALRKIGAENGRVYWRVEGRDADGNAVFSETWIFTIDEGAVTATETTTRSGDGGDSSPCFIDTATH